MTFFSIPEYHAFLSPALARHLLQQAQPVKGVAGLSECGEDAAARAGSLETPEALQFLVNLYQELEGELGAVLAARTRDRKFLDERVRACHEFNRDLGREITEPDYRTVLGLQDSEGRIVFGAKGDHFARPGGRPVAPLPDFLKGPHVTLFGPPDSAKLAINAMNAYHRKLPEEPEIVAELLAQQKAVPMWGADDEDSKTPLHADLVEAAVNLTGCFEGTLSLQEGQKTYTLAKDHLALPLKRFPGLALPCPFLFYRENPIPLHLYDFALHLYRNRANPCALVFYVPKLENEEEARYIHKMVAAAERLIVRHDSTYQPGSVRLMIVLENPRAILRSHEIMDELHPYFAGASLGWHDYLASTARLFKEDANYRIPVKADPEIVIKYIQASHRLLAETVGSRGGIQVGGMYGILPLSGDAASWQVTLRGFFKDVIIQLKRNLTGFWVAHPDFVRLGLALVEAWRQHQAGDSKPLETLVRSLLEEKYQKEVLEFIARPDGAGLDPADPGYVRSLIVADLGESDFISNHDPEEIRYNVFQSLQYLTDWLSGNGCVALPTVIDGVAVRVMDDLATAERSRWEVWHELRHGRFDLGDFVRIVHEEMNFIRRDLSDSRKIVQVKWDERTARWYPIACRIMLELMTSREPVEFATELLLPFTVPEVRDAPDPWKKMQELDPGRYRLEKWVERLHHYFEVCGSIRFARTMAGNTVEDLAAGERVIRSFSVEEVRAAAGFHGDIGQNAATLDARAAGEQALVSAAAQAVRAELIALGEAYRKKFGFKFLISAQGRSAQELLEALKLRLGRSAEQELDSAREALWEITRKRLLSQPSKLGGLLEEVRERHRITGAQICIHDRGTLQTVGFGEAIQGMERVTEKTAFEIASLSKTLGSAFAIEYFTQKGIPLTTSVNELLAHAGSSFRLRSSGEALWGDQVCLEHLMSHSALNMHYVKGFEASRGLPPVLELIEGKHGYERVQVIHEPGKVFQYSGGGFLVLEHLLEALEGKPIAELMRPFLEKCGAGEVDFSGAAVEGRAHGYLDKGEEVTGGGLLFPRIAAGAWSTAGEVAVFLAHLGEAYRKLEGSGGISHDTAVRMLHGRDLGCRAFMGCEMGLGVFTIEAGPNRLMLHQGANEGFRALFLECYSGPDQGRGLVIFCNGDNGGVVFIAEAAGVLLREMGLQGIDLTKLGKALSFEGLPQEQIVNLGYKKLLFEAFEPDLPEAIPRRGKSDPLAQANLAVGAKVLAVTNQKFARAENLLSPFEPVFEPELFGRQGKIMDSWETARHNPLGVDSLCIELTKPGVIRYVSFSTKYHDGNQPEFVKLWGFDGTWRELLPKTALSGHSILRIDLGAGGPKCSQVRVEIFPDGGLTRLGLFEALPTEEARRFQPITLARSERFSEPIPKTRKPLTIPYEAVAEETLTNFKRARRKDLASLAFGGAVNAASNEHYGPAAQVVSPFPPIHMFDGLESARSREPGHHEEVTLRLGRPSKLTGVILDFTFFVNNNPREVSIEGCAGGRWTELVPRTQVKAFAGNQKRFEVCSSESIESLRVKTYPDGGINRIRVETRS